MDVGQNETRRGEEESKYCGGIMVCLSVCLSVQVRLFPLKPNVRYHKVVVDYEPPNMKLGQAKKL